MKEYLREGYVIIENKIAYGSLPEWRMQEWLADHNFILIKGEICKANGCYVFIAKRKKHAKF